MGQFVAILLVVFLGFLGISMPFLIFPALFLNPEYSIFPSDWDPAWHAVFLGITLAAYPIGQFFGSPILGALSDDYGRKRLLSGSLLVSALCNLATGFALEWHLLSLIIISRFIGGLMEGNIAIARAMAADIKTISKHESFGKINASASIAYLLGPLVGGLLADISLTIPFYLISILFLILSLVSTVILKDAPVVAVHRTVWERINLVNRISKLFRNRRLKFLMLVSTFFTLAIDIFYEFGPVYLTDKWTLGPTQLIAYNTVLCIALAIGNGWFASHYSKRYPAPRGIIWATGSFALFLLSIVITDQSWLMLILFTLCGLSIGLGVILLSVKISDSVSDSIQGEVLGVQLSLRVLGDGLICLLGGVLLLLSSKIILVIASLISATTMLFYTKKRRTFASINHKH
jgi:MFS family permease